MDEKEATFKVHHVPVSVIIPTRNRADYLRQALDSVYAQSFQDFEIIVIDDGSTDHTREVVKVYDARLRYYFQEHAGSAGARNYGIRNACGKYIAFLDDDDLYLPQRLQAGFDYLQRHAETVWVCSGFSFIDAGGNLLARNAIIPQKSNITLHDIAMFVFIDTCSVMVRRTNIQAAGGFPQGIAVSEDYHTWARVLQTGRGAALQDILVLYRIHKGNTRLPYRTLLKVNTQIIDSILKTNAEGLLPREVYINNLYKIIKDNLRYQKKFVQYKCFTMLILINKIIRLCR